MQQNSLFHEDIYEALRTDVMASGGFKKVGSLLFPEKSADKAGELLSTCLNTTRPEKLDPQQVVMIKKLAKAQGSFAAVFYECDDIGLSHPTTIEPEDEKARLQREYIESVKALSALASKLEKF